MRGRKVYGKSKDNECLFCGAVAFVKNDQQAPTCLAHKQERIGDMKCLCGSWLDIRESKWGVFFTCMSCGVLSLRKVKEIHPEAFIAKTESRKQMTVMDGRVPVTSHRTTQVIANSQSPKGEVVITSDDVDLYYS
jgi:hypothetical protein